MPNISLKRNMKGIDLFCTSPASTAICSSSTTMVRNGLMSGHDRPTSLHRMNTHLDNQLKNLSNKAANTPIKINAPCISELPFTPRAYRDIMNHQKTRKSSASTTGINNNNPTHDHHHINRRRRSSADVGDATRRKSSADILKDDIRHHPRSYSSRYLLSRDSLMLAVDEDEGGGSSSQYIDQPLALVPSEPVAAEVKIRDGGGGGGRNGQGEDDGVRKKGGNYCDSRKLMSSSEFDKSKAIVWSQQVKATTSSKKDDVSVRGERRRINGSSREVVGAAVELKESPVFKSSCCSKSRDQVVVLRVSLHCKGCAGKLRKHLSKMEGVKSFAIDLDSKKVTVTGDVSPLGVLASISKVKSAQFWPSAPSTSSSSPSNSSYASASTGDPI